MNYAQLIKKPIAYPEVVPLCRQAGLSLNADLETLGSSPRISADPSAHRLLASPFLRPFNGQPWA